VTAAREENLLEIGALHVAAMVVALCGVFALAMTAAEPLFTWILVFGVIGGFTLSWYLARIGVTQQTAGYALTVILAIVTWMSVLSPRLGWAILPTDAFYSPDLSAGSTLGLLLVAYSFTVYSNGARLFVIIPSLAVFGLMGSMNVNTALLVDFSVFILAAIYLVSYEHYLFQRGRHRFSSVTEGPMARAGRWRHHSDHLGIALAMFTALIIPALTLAAILFAVGGYFRGQLLESMGVRPGMYQQYAMRYVGVNAGDRWLRIGQGPVSLPRTPVMVVTSSATENLRGQVYSRYQQRGWTNASDAPESIRAAAPPEADGFTRFELPTPVYGRRVEQRVRLWDPGGSRVGVAYAAGTPHEVRLSPALVNAAHPMLPVDIYGIVTIQVWKYDSEPVYEVVSYVQDLGTPAPVPPVEEEASADEEEFPVFLDRVMELAQSVTVGIEDPEEKVLALSSYLRSHCKYSLDAERVPEGADAVTYFLFDSKEGYCDLFASALAIMSRAVGVPSRVATGYAPGEYDEEQGGHLVRESDAHAWVEVLIPGKGWCTVDPTAGTRSTDPRTAARVLDQFGRLTRRVAPAVALLLLLAGGVVVAIRSRSTVLLSGERVSRRHLNPHDRRQRMIRLYADYCRTLRRRQRLTRRPWQTPSEYLADWKATVGEDAERLAPLDQSVRALTDAFIIARYGDAEIDPVVAARAERAWATLKEKLPRRRKKR
jgi:transglutaminase-like putative cysteine protease